MPSEKGLELLNSRLAEYKFDLKNNVVAMTTDGASVMKKLGRNSGIIHQLCHLHGFHLAVSDVLYKKPVKED